MRYYISRRRHGRFRVAAAILICTAVCAGLIFRIEETRPAMVNLDNFDQIIIDAGHGGLDGGTVGVNGMSEKDINLDIALKLQDFLTISGYDVVMTRTEDVSIHDDSAHTVADKKRSDLQKRLKIVNNNPNSITVSIHQNFFTEGKYSGAQMFYGTKNVLSEYMATCIQDTFVEYLQPENTRQIKPIGSEVYLIHNATTPAVLVECGFLSNPEEAALLATDEYRNKVAFTIFKGIISFLNQNQL
ncbi:MAG TPA: N-acetylmuramoyl-L-alanine amidase [Firmicutes bacterium]|nr:N-acetylmuramoyl-L-alanine amidase [Bacillota bacterium]